MALTTFEQNIKKLNFSFLKKAGEGGVLLTANYESLKQKLASPEVIFALETAKKKFNVDAVYFRYFNDGRSAVPQIYIYDNTDNHLTEKRKDIHIKVWSGCQVPIYIIIDKSVVNVFDAREKAAEDKENDAFETIKMTGAAIKYFSAASFDDGLFWEENNNKDRFQFEKSAYRDLISGLKRVYGSFQKNSGLDNHIALKLLVQCLLIKYLEERDEESKSGYFANTYFQKNFSCANFCEVIRAGKLLDLLDQLAGDFNGKIFEWSNEREAKTRDQIKRSKLSLLADYLDGYNTDNQFVIWRLYSFSHLPVELISSVYEALLTDSKDIVYTPEMIVSTLVDECMPLRSPKINFKVIDVSCGSGIFLVKAYKRIIQWWRYDKWKKTGRLEKPSLETLRQLLLDSIYGIDIQEDAISLAVFSLALALLDEVDLKPPLWQELKFPDIERRNIVKIDFFKFIVQKPGQDFDLVIGNPPFNPPKDEGEKQSGNGAYFKKIKKDYNYESEIKIPDQNVALHFCLQAMKLLKPGAMLCLIQPSVPLFYQKDLDFKRAVFTKFNLLQVIDFTKLSDVLWGDKNVATAAVFMQNSKPDHHDVIHIIANRTFSNVNRLFLDFDHYDFHSIDKDSVTGNLSVWKSNLLGGGRIITLVERISQLRRLRDFLKLKEKVGWRSGEGFIENRNGDLCDYLTDKSYVAANALTEEKIDRNKIVPCDITNFHRPRNKLIYTPPHILIRANIGENNLIVHLSDEYLVFRNKVIGIHAPKEQREVLNDLVQYLQKNGDILRFFILVTSSQLKVNRITVPMTEDFMDLPYPENLKDLEISQAERILIKDVLAYQLNNAEKLLSKTVLVEQIKEFSNIFCQTLNSIYKTDNKAFSLIKILDTGNYYAVNFQYTDESHDPKLEHTTDLEEYIQHIIPTHKNEGKSSHTQKVLKIYGKDRIILSKPKQLRYWLPSIALRDADETFADYIKARYQDA
jgi:methylase of polypeptide subunit release factors